MKQIKQNSSQDTNSKLIKNQNKFQFSTQIDITSNQNTVFYDYKNDQNYISQNYQTVIILNDKMSQNSLVNFSSSSINRSENANTDFYQLALEKPNTSINLEQAENESEQQDFPTQEEIKDINESKEEEIRNENIDQDDLLLINQAKRKNVIKNVMYSFKKFMYLVLNPEENTKQNSITDNTKKPYERIGFFQQPKIEDYLNSNDVEQFTMESTQSQIKSLFNQNQQERENNLIEIYQKFKRYIENKPFNHQTVCLLINHQQYSSIFKFFLTNFIDQQLQNSKIQDLLSHQKVIQFLLLSYENKSLLDSLQKHKKRKFFQINKKIKKKDKKCNNC